jgi:hypothetical protein
MSTHSSRTTTDHNQIRQWAEARGAKPSRVKGTGRGDDPGMIRLDFPGYSGAGSLESISWDEWFKAFDDNGLALVYQDRTADGERSNFNKLIARDTADAREHGDSHASRHAGSSSSSSHRSQRSHSGSAPSRASHREPQHASDRDRESLEDREYRDADGTVHHHTHKYMDEHRDD